jgi:murein DD-endopeptidase MepM/ murein hydrolase activator NlpD
MTQRPDSKRISPHFFSQRRLIAGGLSCLSGMSFLGSAGVALAQTSAPPETPAVPSANDLFAPAPAPEAIAVEPQPAPPETIAPEAVPEAPAAPAPEAITPAPVTPVIITPSFAEPANPSVSNYIDTTPYDLGATTYQSPSAIVLSERSSGCQAVVNKGDVAPGSICAQLQSGGSVAQSPNGGGSGSSYAGGYNSVSVGPVSLSPYGISLSGRSTPSARDYYNLTSRPPAKLTSGNVGMLFPLSIPSVITSVFGWRIHPISGESRFHSGTDLGADEGTPVVAAFGGKVQLADFMGGYGLTVVLQHNKGKEETLYAHLSELFVKPGETVKQGEVIGRVGSTGFSTGPHLHFEFRQQSADGSWVTMDPGQALEFSLAKFITNLQTAQSKKPGTQVAIDPLQRLKVVLQEAKQAQLAKKNIQPSNAARAATADDLQSIINLGKVD